MRYLVVNADDFGASVGVNRGIVESHRRGVVTSASLTVAMPGSEEAAHMSHECPDLSVGLHVCLCDGRSGPIAEHTDPSACRAALEAQLSRFEELIGGRPTHLDSHHHVHVRPRLRPEFQEVADRYRIPLRECSPVRYCSRFYGQWAGEHHPEQVSVVRLIRILETEIVAGVTELGCHPGYADPTLASSYAAERELELRTLCDDRVRRFLEGSDIELVGFGDLPRVLFPAG
jgi:chitin disaccharide deacetylase